MSKLLATPTLAEHCPTLLKDMQQDLRDAEESDDVERWCQARERLVLAEQNCRRNLEQRYRNAIEDMSAAGLDEGIINDLRRALGRVMWSDRLKYVPELAGGPAAMFPNSQERAPRGRPQSVDRVRLDAAASIWLDQIGTPEKQADLVRVLADWCLVEGIDLGERTIRTVADVAIRKHEERRGRLD